nr:MarR family transcriptional regulator [Gammaproteobacteria bacterium]
MNNKNPQLDLSNQLCFPLYACSRKIVNLYTPYLKDLDLTYTEYLVLLVLWEKDNILVKDICNRLHLDNGTISPLLKKMESKDMIKRVRSTEDDRKVLIS